MHASFMQAKILHTKQKYIENTAQVHMLTTIIPDFATKEVRKMIGATEIRAPMKKGPRGKIVATFADGAVEIDYSNLMLDVRPASIKKRPAAKGSPAYKRPAAAPAREDSDTEEMSKGEEDSIEEEQEEAEEESQEEETAPVPPPLPAAPAEPAPVPAAPAVPEDRSR